MSINTNYFSNETAIIKNSVMRIPALRELAAIIPIFLIVGIGYRQISIIAVIILGLATANRGITTHQKPILADHVSVVLFLSLISLTWVLVLESHTLVRNIVVGVIIATIFCLLGRGISLLAHERLDAALRNTSTSEVLHWSLLSSIAVTALGWSSLFYYSIALALVIVIRRRVKGSTTNILSLLLVGLGSIVSWSVRRQNEGQFWMSYDQLFRSSIAEGLSKWGRNDFVGATGTTLSYHWLGEATAGVISRLAGISAVDGVVKVLPTLAIVFSLSALVQLGNRLNFSREQILVSSLLTVIFCHDFVIYSIGTIWGFVLFLIGLDSLERFRRELSGDSSIRLALAILVLGISVTLTLAQTTLGLYFVVLTAIFFGSLMLQERIFKASALAVVISQALTLMFLRANVLAGSDQNGFQADATYQPSISIRNVLQFSRLDLYYGDQWIFISLTSLLFLLLMSQMMSGFALISWQRFRCHKAFLLFVTVTTTSLLLSNILLIGGGSDPQQARFLSPLVVFGTFLSFSLFIQEVRNHPFKGQQGIRMAATATSVVVLLGLLLYLKDLIRIQEFSRQKQLNVGFFIVGTQTMFILLFLLRLRTVGRSTSRLLVSLLIGGLIFVAHSSGLQKFTNALPRPIDRQREEAFTGSFETQKCLKFVRDETPRESIVASNWLRIPHWSNQKRYFLVSAWTERRTYVDGVTAYIDESVEDRVTTSDDFAESANETAFSALRLANVSFFIVNKERDTATSWEPYATPIFERSTCLVLKLSQPVG